MSDKLNCPGCGSYSSTVLAAVAEEGECPFCHLSADAIYAVNAARERSADEALVERALSAEKRASDAERRANAAERALRLIRDALDEAQG